ncbi:hypothetical protein [Actinomadura sp. B10D3]|uniref:hypothetical protein n=1 Tax=Actinomadura sp. B10D3 TaxID=3153557 RepID=UPI00325FDA04
MNIPEDEVVAAVRRGISLSDYIRAREAASHTETLEAHAAAGDLFEYTWQRGSGRGHLPAMEAAEGKPFSANERVEIEAAPDAGARESLREDRSRTPLEEKVFAEVPIGAVYEHQPN